MANYKNQHFVPKCMLRQFAPDERLRSLNVFNLRSGKTIAGASLKSQASGSYLYGKDLKLEGLLAGIEGGFNQVLERITAGSDTDGNRDELRFFTYLQHRRTQMAVQRLKHAYDDMQVKVFGEEGDGPPLPTNYELMIQSLVLCMQTKDDIADLKSRIIENKTKIDFVTSDDPAVLVNRYAAQRLNYSGFGVSSSGVILLMPLTPTFAFICYDNQVYTAPDLDGGRIVVKRDVDVEAINEFQFLKAAENVYFKSWDKKEQTEAEFVACKGNRCDDWSEIEVLVRDDNGKDGFLRDKDGKLQAYRKGTREEGRAAGSALLKLTFKQPLPTRWFPQLKFRSKIKTFYNGTGVGHVRKEEWLRSRKRP